MKEVVRGEIKSSKENFRNIDGKKVDLLIEKVIRKIKKRLNKMRE